MEMNDLFPFLAMIPVQIGFAGMNLTSKLAMDYGMKPLVLVTYRQIFATFALIPFTYFFERVTGNQVFYFLGRKIPPPTIGCALTNILPATTFILAVLLGQETLGLKKISGQVKVLGTAICVGGAMLLSFYHGQVINAIESDIHWTYADKMGNTSSSNKSNSFLGPLLIMAAAVSWSIWFIIQYFAGESVRQVSTPNTSRFLMCLMGSIELMVIGASANHELPEWSLRSPVRLVAALYAGIVCSALAFCLTSWSISKKGALYVSVFSRLLLVIVPVLSWALLRQKLYPGTGVGSMMMVGGLYAVLWGKGKEAKYSKKNIREMEAFNLNMNLKKAGEKEDDLELQLPLLLGKYSKKNIREMEAFHLNINLKKAGEKEDDLELQLFFFFTITITITLIIITAEAILLIIN